jgi:hypothetical protein
MKTLALFKTQTQQQQPFCFHTMPSDDLCSLQGYIKARRELYEKGCIVALSLLVSTPIWFLIGVVVGLSGATELATIFIRLIPFSLMASLGLWLFLYFVVFSDVSRNAETLFYVENELTRRNRVRFSFASEN